MIAAYVNGYNNLVVVLGVFDDLDQAHMCFVEHGCRWLSYRERYPKQVTWFPHQNPEKRELWVTDIFTEYMDSRNLPWYSTGSIEDFYISFREIKVNYIEFGYDDD